MRLFNCPQVTPAAYRREWQHVSALLTRMQPRPHSKLAIPMCPQVTPAAYRREWQHVKALLATLPPPTLVLDRVVLAPTGTLLVTWRNPDGRVAAFRRRMAAEFPGASDRQVGVVRIRNCIVDST